MVSYSYEVEGQIQAAQYLLTVTEAKRLSGQQIRALLTQEGVQVGDALWMRREDGVYVSLQPDQQVELPSHILVRFPRACTCESLNQRVETLEAELLALRNELIERQPLSVAYEVDISVLIAAPLVKSSLTLRSVSDSDFNFEKERSEMLAFMRQESLGVALRFDAATMHNLVEVLSRKPKVLQIECHGAYDKQDRFYLGFEDSVSLGLLEKVTPERLRATLEGKISHEMIVLLNACHSEEIAQAFIDAGARCVIAVHRECRVLGQSTRPFALQLYKALCAGASVSEALEQTKKIVTEMKKAKDYVCCCAHQHTEDCLWYKSARLCRKNRKQGHQRHTPDTAQCTCANMVLHRPACQWALAFRREYCPLEPSEHGGEFTLCCCRPSLPHDEGSKYVLLGGGEFVLFHDLGPDLIERDPLPITEPPLVQKPTRNRHQEIQQLADWLCRPATRGVIVWGEAGVGKSIVVKRAAQYLFERKRFRYGVVYADLEGQTFISGLYEQLSSAFKLPDRFSRMALCRLIKDLSVLIVLDGLDSLLTQDENELSHSLQYLLENTRNAKFVAVSRRKFRCDSFEEWNLQPFSKEKASRLLVSLARNFLPEDLRRNPKLLIRHQLWDLVRPTPERVQEIARILATKSLAAIIEDLNSEFCARDREEAADKLALTYFAEHQTALAVYRLVCHFPHGLRERDLSIVAERLGVDWKEGLAQLQGDSESGFLRLEEEEELLRARPGLREYVGSLQSFSESLVPVVQHLAALARSLVMLLEPLCESRSEVLVFDATLDSGVWASAFPDISRKLCRAVTDPKREFELFRGNFAHYQTRRYDNVTGELKTALSELVLCTVTGLCLLGLQRKAVDWALGPAAQLSEQCGLDRLAHLLSITAGSLDPSLKARIAQNSATELQAESDLLRGLLGETRYLTAALERFDDSALGAARAALALAEHAIHQGKATKTEAKLLDTAVQTLTQCGKWHWVVRTMLVTCDYYVLAELYEKAAVECEKALVICARLKDRQAEIEVRKKLSEVQQQLQERATDMFCFLLSSPLVRVAQGKLLTVGHWHPAVHSRIRDVMEQNHSAMSYRWYTGDRRNLQEALATGCRLLVVFSRAEGKFLMLEAQDGAVDRVSPTELNPAKMKQVDVLLLIGASAVFAQAALSHWHVSRVLCLQVQLDDWNHPLLSEASLLFAETLISSFVQGLDFALAKAEKGLKEYLRLQEADEWVRVVDLENSTPPRPLPDKTGPCLDLSPQCAPSILPAPSVFVGRQLELHTALQALRSGKCVHVIGPPGVGKTAFLSALGNFLHARNTYPSGVFELSLGMRALSEVLSEERVAQHDQSGAVRSTLLLLDDCDELVCSPGSLEYTLQTYTQEFALAIVCASGAETATCPGWIAKVRIRPLDLDESVLLLMQLCPELCVEQVTESDEFTTVAAALRADKKLRACRGLPGRIHELAAHILNCPVHLLEDSFTILRSDSLGSPRQAVIEPHRRNTIGPSLRLLSRP